MALTSCPAQSEYHYVHCLLSDDLKHQVLQHLPMITGGATGDLRQVWHLNAFFMATFRANGILESGFKVTRSCILAFISERVSPISFNFSNTGSIGHMLFLHILALCFNSGLTCLLRAPSETANTSWLGFGTSNLGLQGCQEFVIHQL